MCGSARWSRGLALALVLSSAAVVTGQTTARMATSVQTILRYPAYFHGRAIALVAAPSDASGLWQLAVPSPRTFVVVPAGGRLDERPVEIRGTFVDVGQLSPDDSRISSWNLRPIIQRLSPDRWPERQQLLAIVGATSLEPPGPTDKTLRAVVLAPDAYQGRSITLRGRFRGQNLYGDLPAWPRQSRWDFVLQSADASIWVTGLRPRGKGFDLDPTIRRGAGTWLQVSGTIQQSDGLPRLDGEAAEQILIPPDEEPAISQPIARSADPPAILFTAPREGAADVDPTTSVRIQFSRDMRESTFAGRVRVVYGPDTKVVPPAVRVTSLALRQAIELQFASPLASNATVVVLLAEGITAADGTPLAPTKISFKTGR